MPPTCQVLLKYAHNLDEIGMSSPSQMPGNFLVVLLSPRVTSRTHAVKSLLSWGYMDLEAWLWGSAQH